MSDGDVGAVSGSESASGGETSVPASNPSQSTEGNSGQSSGQNAVPSRGGSENAIPHWRVKEMLAEKETRFSSELAALKKQLEQSNAGYQQLGDHLLQGLGIARPEKKPNYIEAEQLTQHLTSQKRELAIELEKVRLEGAMERLRSKYSESFELPGFIPELLHRYGNSREPLEEIASALDKQYQAALQKRQQAYIAQKEAAAQNVPTKAGGGGAVNGTSKGQPKSAVDRVKAMLQGE